MTQSVKSLMDNNPALTAALCTLENAGHQAHLVGGAPRNALMGVPVKDFDISTSAHPAEVTALFEGLGHSVHPTGIEHGTVTVAIDEDAFEITTWRQDVATDGRRATIAFAQSMEEDALRRDFTINALYADRHGEIFDPTGLGLEDAAARRVRFIQDASTRIQEDALRILRYFRFSAAFTHGSDEASADYQACKEFAHLVSTLSSERIGQEMRRILGFQEVSYSLQSMNRAGVLAHALPEAGRSRLTQLHQMEAMEKAFGLSPCFVRRLVFLCSKPPKDGLRLSRAETKRHIRLGYALRAELLPAELGYHLGKTDGEDVLCIQAALDEPWVDDGSLQDLQEAVGRACPLTGRDLMPYFKGKALGDALKIAESAWISSGFSATQDQLLQELEITP